MNDTQCGFGSGRSTVSQLLRCYNSALTKLEEGSIVDSIYLDFAKAFGKVDYNILLLKAKDLNINGMVLRWIEIGL